MVECYYKWCVNHYKDEPFCKLYECVASNEQMLEFKKLRDEEMERHRDKGTGSG